MWFLRLKNAVLCQFREPSVVINNPELKFICPVTGRHLLDQLYEIFAKPQLQILGGFKPDEPSIYVNHHVGQKVAGDYRIDRIFEDPLTGFYAEGRMPLSGTNPPVLVIRGYGSWYPFERVLEDTPDVLIARWDWQLKAAEKQGVIDWLKQAGEIGVKPDIIGESLGGKVAQQIVAKYSEYIRSTVTFNALGISRKLAETSQVPHVFHYFTLGEVYAFWANRGDYLSGTFFQISKNGKSCSYRIEEAIVQLAWRRSSMKAGRGEQKRTLVPCILAQLILLKRHNDLILNRRHPVVIKIDRHQLEEMMNRS